MKRSDHYPGSGGRDAFERPPGAAEVVFEEFATGKLHPEWHGREKSDPTSERYTDDVLRRVQEREADLIRAREAAKARDEDREKDR